MVMSRRSGHLTTLWDRTGINSRPLDLQLDTLPTVLQPLTLLKGSGGWGQNVDTVVLAYLQVLGSHGP